jgi:S1-C subfamily serine protease
VLRFARTSKVQGTSVSGAGYSGIAVRGAQALGVANGDVLTHVNGQPVGSVSDVTAIVLSALGAGQKRISGTLLRPSLPDSGPRTYPITVEVPAQAGADSH